MKRFTRQASHLPAAGQCVKLGPDPTQGFVVLGAQMVGAALVPELVDEQPNDIFRDPALELVSAEAQFVENQFAARTV